jgi:hypothetical protein
MYLSVIRNTRVSFNCMIIKEIRKMRSVLFINLIFIDYVKFIQ